MKTRVASVLTLALLCSLPCSGESLVDRKCQGTQATGQTQSFTPFDDGYYRDGWTVSPRFRDNGDGTVTDNLTGLVWLKNANCFALAKWFVAVQYAQALADDQYDFCGLSDGSKPGDWRLPNIRELLSLIDYSTDSGLPNGHPFENVGQYLGDYWSSTPKSDMSTMYYWLLGGVFTTIHGIDHQYGVWPVRDQFPRGRRP